MDLYQVPPGIEIAQFWQQMTKLLLNLEMMGIKPKPDNKDNRERKRDGGGVNGNNFIPAKSN